MRRVPRIKYCVIDETDPPDEFECEGEVIRVLSLRTRSQKYLSAVIVRSTD